jgi:hypothetical protein
VFEKLRNLEVHYVTITTNGEANLLSFSAKRTSPPAARPEARSATLASAVMQSTPASLPPRRVAGFWRLPYRHRHFFEVVLPVD